VLEGLFKFKKIRKHLDYPLYIGVIYTLIAFVTSYLLFNQARHLIGTSTILFVVVLAIPIVSRMFSSEEKIEAKSKKPFLKRHKVCIDFFVYFFIGVFLTFFMISLISPSLIFSEGTLTGIESTTQQIIRRGPGPPPPGPAGTTLIQSIFINNAYVMLIAFLLSLFYGAGAIFLLVLNASIFASALSNVIRITAPATGFLPLVSFISCNVGIMFFHMIPEVGGYLIAAIAGGILSTAIAKEKLFSKKFNRILKSSLFLIFGALVLLWIAALVEVNVSQKLFSANACIGNTSWILIIALLIIVGTIVFEYYRSRR